MIANDLRRMSKLYIKALGQFLPPPHSEFMAETILLVAGSKTPVTVERLIYHLENDKRTIIKLLEELVTVGYVSIIKISSLKKDDQIVLTEMGRQLLPQVQEAIALTEQRLKGKSKDMDLETFTDILKRMENNLKPY
ncbi:hypothetical protein [Mucilaginibacter phyllosphaerae]